MTKPAPASSAGGTAMPRASAVLRLMANSKVVGCSTGRSEGLAPLESCPRRSPCVGSSPAPWRHRPCGRLLPRIPWSRTWWADDTAPQAPPGACDSRRSWDSDTGTSHRRAPPPCRQRHARIAPAYALRRTAASGQDLAPPVPWRWRVGARTTHSLRAFFSRPHSRGRRIPPKSARVTGASTGAGISSPIHAILGCACTRLQAADQRGEVSPVQVAPLRVTRHSTVRSMDYPGASDAFDATGTA